jgi:hypothetical protein
MPPPEVRPSVRRALGAVVVGFGLFLAYFSGVFSPFSNPNELSRLQAVVAMADHGTFSIDEPVRRLGNHEDKAESGGRYYSNKAPGLAFAALPVYKLLRVALPPPEFGTRDLIFYLLRLLTVSAVCVLALARFGVRVAQSARDDRIAPMLTLAIAFGTPYLFYARSFFGHAWTAALLFLSWDVLRSSEGPMRRSREALLLASAGLLAGWAVFSEYTVAPIALFLALRCTAGRSWRSILWFLLGAAVPAGLLLTYQAICFGSPFLPSYAKESYPAYAELARRKLFGLGVPSPEVAVQYLFHPARGLFVFSPFLLWFVGGAVRWWRSGRERADCVFTLASSLSFFLLLAGYPNWHGGWSLGSRYLLPALFFLGLPIARALSTPLSRGLFYAAVVFSVATHFVLTAAWTHFPLELGWPAATGSLWFLAHGWVAPNLLSSAGAPLAIALAIPAFLLAAILFLALREAPPASPRAPIAALAGIAPLLLLLLRPPQPEYLGRLWRASVLGAFSGTDPYRQELRNVAREASSEQERQMAMRAWRVYGPRW